MRKNNILLPIIGIALFTFVIWGSCTSCNTAKHISARYTIEHPQYGRVDIEVTDGKVVAKIHDKWQIIPIDSITVWDAYRVPKGQAKAVKP